MSYDLAEHIERASELLTTVGKTHPYMLVFGTDLQLSLSNCIIGEGINLMLEDVFPESDQFKVVTLYAEGGGDVTSVTGVAFKSAADREKLSGVLEKVEPAKTVAAVAVINGALGPVVQRSPV